MPRHALASLHDHGNGRTEELHPTLATHTHQGNSAASGVFVAEAGEDGAGQGPRTSRAGKDWDQWGLPLLDPAFRVWLQSLSWRLSSLCLQNSWCFSRELFGVPGLS